MRALILRYSLTLLLLSSLVVLSHAQEFNDDEIPIDSTNISIQKGENGFSKLFRGKPGKSALYASLIPGGGHFYNRKYLSGVLAAGADIFMLYQAIDQNNFYNQLNDGYLCLLRDPAPNKQITIKFNGEDIPFTDVDIVRTNRNNARRTREYQWLYAGLTHFGTIVWAYVQAHLIDFDDSEDLSIDLKFIPYNTLGLAGITPSLSLSFNLNKTPEPIRYINF